MLLRAMQTATLRDQFAMAALTGIISQSLSAGQLSRAKLAYEYADAMMEERDAENWVVRT